MKDRTATFGSIVATHVNGNIKLTTVHRGGLVDSDGFVSIQRGDVIDVLCALLRFRPDLHGHVRAIIGK